MCDLDPLDLDLTAQIYLRFGLILSVRLGSYGSALLGARAAALRRSWPNLALRAWF
jgi:hypothetical protein